MTSHSKAFAENKNEMLSYGVSSIAPAANGYGVNGTPEISGNNDNAPLPYSNNDNAPLPRGNDQTFSSAMIAGNNINADAPQGLNVNSANVISPMNTAKQDGIGYVGGSALSAMSDLLGSMRSKQPELEMASPAPQMKPPSHAFGFL